MSFPSVRMRRLHRTPALRDVVHKTRIHPSPRMHACEELKKALVDLSSNYHAEAQVNSIASMFQIFFSPHTIIDYTSAK